jgi:hypothetical protein
VQLYCYTIDAFDSTSTYGYEGLIEEGFVQVCCNRLQIVVYGDRSITTANGSRKLHVH